jgi:EAL domain-containing protein (putative c-di-GMP-specific phosphodiesterase class I)
MARRRPVTGGTESATLGMRDPARAGDPVGATGAGPTRIGIDDFVDGLATDDDDRAIAEAVVTLAHRVRLTVTAEGVQTAEQLAVLRDLGCDQWQGCLFGPPDTAEVASRLL